MSPSSLERPNGLSIALPAFGFRDRSIGAAVAVSLLIHAAALGWLPGRRGPMTETPQPLRIRLPQPVVQDESIAVPPAPTFKPASGAKRSEEALTRQEVLPVLTSPALSPSQDSPAVRSSEPVRAAIEVVRPNPALASVGVERPDLGALAAYGRELAGAVATRQRYPRIALLRQWQGTTLLQLEMAADGRLLAVRVLSSSGHESLDRQALDMVREAVPLPAFPSALAGRPLTVDVPVVFRITS